MTSVVLPASTWAGFASRPYQGAPCLRRDGHAQAAFGDLGDLEPPPGVGRDGEISRRRRGLAGVEGKDGHREAADRLRVLGHDAPLQLTDRPEGDRLLADLAGPEHDLLGA